MTGETLFDSFSVFYSMIRPYVKIDEFFMEIRKSIKDVGIIDSFSQLKKDDKGSGLAFEVMFFDDKVIHDLKFTSTSINFSAVPIKNIDSINIQVFNDQSIYARPDSATIDKLELTIVISGKEPMKLIYSTDTNRFSEFIRIKKNLLELL